MPPTAAVAADRVRVHRRYPRGLYVHRSSPPPAAPQLTTRPTLPGRRPPLFVNKVRDAHGVTLGGQYSDCRPRCCGLVLSTHEMPRLSGTCQFVITSSNQDSFQINTNNKQQSEKFCVSRLELSSVRQLTFHCLEGHPTKSLNPCCVLPDQDSCRHEHMA